MLKGQIWFSFVVRRCSTFHSKLKNQNIVEKLSKTNEDIASIVRFNRPVVKLIPEDFKVFYSAKDNPNRSERELTEIKLKIALICCQHNYLCSLNVRVPSSLTMEDMKHLLRLDSPEYRELYLVRAYFRDTVKIKHKMKQFVKAQLKGTEKAVFQLGCFDAEGQLQYGLWKNSMFVRTKRNSRILLQNGINAALWGSTLALDWTLPIAHSETVQSISRRSVYNFVYAIYTLCNANLKHSVSHHATFNLVHLGLNRTHFCLNDLIQMYNDCAIDQAFWQSSEKSYLETYSNQKLIYINPFASDTLQEDEITEIDNDGGVVFVVTPYTELFGLKKSEVQSLMEMKQSESKGNVLHRRLPLHNMIDRSLHLVLSHQIQCLREVIINGKSWDEAVQKTVPNKYLKK